MLIKRAADNLTEPPGLARAASSEPTRRKCRQEPPPQTGRQMPSGSNEHQRQPCNGREVPNGSLTAPLPALLGVWAGVTVPGPRRALSASASRENGGQSWELAVGLLAWPLLQGTKGREAFSLGSCLHLSGVSQPGFLMHPEFLGLGLWQHVVLRAWEPHLVFRRHSHKRMREHMLPWALASVGKQDPGLISEERDGEGQRAGQGI